MKFTDEQTELLALLPQDLKNSQELTDSARLVLSNIIFLYGMEDAQKNGYVYRSYDDLMKDTFIKSKTSISKAIALLVQKEYIKVKSGRLKDRKANEFTLLDDTLLNKKCTEKCTDKNEKCTEKCTLTDYWTNKIESLENEIVLLKKEIEELKKCTDKCTEKCTDKNEKCTEKCTTDPEPESETKINNKNNNIITGILEHKEPEVEVTEVKKENKKEKVNEKKPAYGNLTGDLFDEIFGNEENEMSDNGTSVMNAKSEMKCNVQQRKSIALGCDKINEMTTSTQGNIITSNSGNGEHKVQSGKVISNCSIFTENCPKPYLTPQIPLTPLSSPNKATGDVQTTKVEQLPTNEIKTRQNAQECPQIEFDEKWYNETYALMNNLNTLEDLDKLYNRLKQNKNKRLIIDFNRIVWDSRSNVNENLKNRLAQMSADLERMTA